LQDLEYIERPQMKRSILITAFSGWSDASEAATRAARFLVRELRATRFATIDPEEFFVFTEQRPTVFNDRNSKRRLRWPRNRFYAWRPEDPKERDIVILVGTEPNLRWRRFTENLMDVVKTCNVEMLVTMGSLLDAVPHTRPARITTSANTEDLGEGLSHVKWSPPQYEGPTGITAAVTDALSRHGIPSASVWGHAPHYLQVRPNPTVTLALLQSMQPFVSQPLNLSRLERSASEFETNVARALEDQEQVKGYVEQLEQKYDLEGPASSKQEYFSDADADAIVADVEAFFRKNNEGGGQEGSADG
jgi:proteasome assembly chaperone (PAC2) family protein